VSSSSDDTSVVSELDSEHIEVRLGTVLLVEVVASKASGCGNDGEGGHCGGASTLSKL